MSTVYSVYQISSYIKNMFRQDYLLSGTVQVQGEVSNCKDHSTGLYFTLKDDKAVIKCVMFRSASAGLAFSLHPGDSVIVTGNIDTYVKGGEYQLYAKRIEKAGSGALYEEFLKLKKKLEELGMFDSQYKRAIPPFVQKIGIVTAPDGAVIRDIANVARRRHPGIELFLYPSLVQGERAAAEIVAGIETLDEMGMDVLIVGRGGGSMEDLWVFNEEAVAHAIFNAKTPVISAVGHETDFTIADFVADLRAPTPSAAAELAVPDIREKLENLHQTEMRLSFVMNNILMLNKKTLDGYNVKLNASGPENVLRLYRERISNREQLLNSSMEKALKEEKNRISIAAGRLDGASPQKKLSQGYSYIEGTNGKGISSIKAVQPEDRIVVYVADGTINGTVNSIHASKE